MQQHNLRNNAAGMTIGWEIFGNQVEKAVPKNIVAKLIQLGQVIQWEDNSYDLGAIPNLHSLVPYSQAARKPIFDCGGGDGARGAHLSKARESFGLFEPMADTQTRLLALLSLTPTGWLESTAKVSMP